MNLLKIALLSGTFASASILSVSALTFEEPIPDFSFEVVGEKDSDMDRETGKRSGKGNVNMVARNREIQIARLALQKLDLTQAQEAKVQAIFSTSAMDSKMLRSEIRLAQDTLQAARQSAEANAAVIEEVSAELVSLGTKASILRAEVRQSVLNVLTVEQEDKFNQIQDRLRQKSKRRIQA